MSRINLNAVAKEAQVAVSTASLALNGRSQVGLAEETIRRVRQAAERLGYTQNHNARSLRLQRSGMVGVIIAGASPLHARLMDGIREGLDSSKQEMLPLLTTHSYNSAREYQEVRFLLRNQVEAIIATPKGPYAENYAPVLSSDIPVVFAIHSTPESPAEGDGPSMVLHDNQGMAREGGLHVIATGARRIAYLAWDFDTLVSHEKLLGVRQAVEGDPLISLKIFMQPPETSFDATLDSLFSDPATAPDAVLCNPSTVALQCLDFFDRRGISIPGQCSLLSLNNGEMFNCRRIHVTATTVDTDWIGRRAAELALSLIGAKNRKPVRERHNCYRLIERSTTLPLPRGR